MSQDPFERMRRNNPVPPDQAPSAPMSVADRILGVRSSRPGWMVAAVAAAAVVVVGGVTLLLVDGTDSTVVADATTSSVPVPATADSTPTTTTVVHPTTTLGSGDEFTAIVYLFTPGVEGTFRSRPNLTPVARRVRTIEVVAGTIRALVEGVPAGTSELSTAIPDGTTVSIRSLGGPIIDIDLSSEFVAAGDSPSSMRDRLAQVVYTLTAIDGIEGVRFLIDGVPTTIFGGEGIETVEVNDPATRADFENLLPAIMIETPPYGGSTSTPFVASGSANVFEASVSLALADGDGLIIWEGFTTATCGTGCRGDWSIEIPFDVDELQLGSLIAWEESARDGRQINIREHPVWLAPSEFAVTTLAPDE